MYVLSGVFKSSRKFVCTNNTKELEIFLHPFSLSNSLILFRLFTMAGQGQPVRLGGNLALASLLATLSYVPFEFVAKGSLIVCAFLFILDPIPPLSRLLSLVCLLIISLLSRLHKQYKTLQEEEETIQVTANKAGEEQEEKDKKKES